MPFNKNRFFRSHYHTLDNCSTGEMLSFPYITDVKWQKLISRRYTSIGHSRTVSFLSLPAF
ncbi:hypothetical protein FR830_24920 (plasmid) [Klebsiella aerogenes]|nr:hypothetical protein FR830_24920 [Klebsiella aerogenes]